MDATSKVDTQHITLAVVGTSMISETCIEAIDQVKTIEVVGVFSRHKEKAEAFQNMHPSYKVWDSFEDLAQDASVDAVYIASPNAFHVEQALRMIQAHKHVLLEKPLAPTLKEAKLLFEAAQKEGVVLLEAMRFMYDPGTAAVLDALKKIGPVRSASFSFGKKSSRYDELLKGHVTNIFCPKMAGGALMDTGVYALNAMVSLFGEPADVSSFSVTVNNAELMANAAKNGDSGSADPQSPQSCAVGAPPIIDICGSALCTYEDKVISCSWTKCTDAYGEAFGGATIEGEQGTLRWSKIPEPTDVVVYYHNGKTEALSTPVCPVSKASKGDVNNMSHELRAFADRVLETKATGILSTFPENRLTEITCGLLENIRLSSGVVFPSDKAQMDE